MRTGLDYLIATIRHDPGLRANVSLADRQDAAEAARKMNAKVVKAIKATDVAHDGELSPDDVRAVNGAIRAADGRNDNWSWAQLHGDDENGEETGFHLVQNDGAVTTLFGENAIDTVADGIYHLGFEIQGENFLNEDGAANVTVGQVSEWLNGLLAYDLEMTKMLVDSGVGSEGGFLT